MGCKGSPQGGLCAGDRSCPPHRCWRGQALHGLAQAAVALRLVCGGLAGQLAGQRLDSPQLRRGLLLRLPLPLVERGLPPHEHGAVGLGGGQRRRGAVQHPKLAVGGRAAVHCAAGWVGGESGTASAPLRTCGGCGEGRRRWSLKAAGPLRRGAPAPSAFRACADEGNGRQRVAAAAAGALRPSPAFARSPSVFLHGR